MTARHTLLATLILTLGMFTGAGSAKADHLHDLAEDLEGMSGQLMVEFREHYRYLPEYRHLLHDAGEVAELAQHIHDLTDRGAGADHIHDDLHELEDLYHHLDETLDRVERNRGFRHGTRHVRGLMHTFHDTLEHMLEDVEEMQAPRPRFNPVRPPIGGGRPGIQFQFGRAFGR